MAATMKIPTVFTAVDKFTSVVSKMASGVSTFTKTTGAAVSRVNTKIDGLFNKMGNISQLLLGLSFGAILGSAITDLKAYEDGVASFRTIVSDLSDKDFAKYTASINQVAKETKKSTIDVVMSYEKIAGLNAKFAETSDGIAAISKASIVLSRASKDELGASTENLVGIMNQFSLGAKEADRVINVLAAGQAVGASTITQSAEAYKNFGAVAKGANITLEESQALIQTLGKYSLFGAEAGTKLRGATLQLQKAGLGYKSGQFSINDALEDANEITKKLTTQRAKDTFILKTFGAENITAGKILLANIDTYKEFTKGVTGTSEAQKAAEINSNTLSEKINELKDSFTNYLTTNDQTIGGLNLAKGALGFLASNIDLVVLSVISIIGFLALLKTIMIISSTWTFLSSIAMGVYGAATGKASIAIGKNTVALAAYKTMQTLMTVGTWLATAATTAFGVAMAIATSPIFLIIAAIAAIIAIFYYWDEIVAWFSKQWETFTNFISALWTGIVTFFEEFSFVDFFRDIGQAIINWMLMPLKTVLKLVSLIPGSIGEAAKSGLDKLNEFTDLSNVIGSKKEVLQSPQEVQAQNQQSEAGKFKGRLDINVNDPNKLTTVESNVYGTPVTVSSTLGF
jgi:TP901 family phage tail tape measure protein